MIQLRTAAAELARAIWRAAPIPKSWRSTFGVAMIASVNAGLLGRRAARAAPIPLSDVQTGPLVLSGFMNSVLGIGSGGRSTAAALLAAGLAPLRHDIAPVLDLRIDRLAPRLGPPGGVWIAHCNPPELMRVLAALPFDALEGRYRIGFWAWELPVLPPRWAEAADHLNEIWAPTRYVADAILDAVRDRRHVPTVRVMPHPLPDLSHVRADRARFGLPQDAVVVLVMFDMRSSRARKNPDAAVEAFIRAFPEPRSDRVLFCKVVGADASTEDWVALRRRVSGRPDLILADALLSTDETFSLIASADIVLSTHRAEGYGLILAEAMALERCVIATGWSGNTDFMSDANSVLLPSRPIPVVDPQGIYPAGQHWADVDIDATAALLRAAADDPARRTALGARARADIQRHDRQFAHALSQAPWLSKISGPAAARE